MQAPSAPNQHSRCVPVVVIIFVACCLLSTGRIAWQARTPDAVRHSSIDIELSSDARFSALKRDLPRRGVIGYIGEPGALARGDYYLTEYALSPLVVDDSTNHPLVVANFPNLPPVAPSGLQLVKDFGHGVALFANKDAR